MKTYTIASPEGAVRYAAELGQEVELKLDDHEEQAVVAAGWLEPAKKAKEATK
jgi:hypothetical protein